MFLPRLNAGCATVAATVAIAAWKQQSTAQIVGNQASYFITSRPLFLWWLRCQTRSPSLKTRKCVTASVAACPTPENNIWRRSSAGNGKGDSQKF
jgi:hypothetical protein